MQRRRGALRLVAALLPLLAAAAAAPAGASIAAAAGGPADSAPHRGSVALSAGGDTLIARDDAYTVAAGQTLRPQTSADLLLANDELVPGPNAAAGPSAGAAGASGRRFWAQALLGQPSGSGGAVADLTPDGNFTFVPSAGWSGLTVFTYLITDGRLYAAANVTVNVLPAAAPDTAAPANSTPPCATAGACAPPPPGPDAPRLAAALGVPLGGLAAAAVCAALFDRWRLARRGGRQYRVSSLAHQPTAASKSSAGSAQHAAAAALYQHEQGAGSFAVPHRPAGWPQPPPAPCRSPPPLAIIVPSGHYAPSPGAAAVPLTAPAAGGRAPQQSWSPQLPLPPSFAAVHRQRSAAF